ncbi:MAG: hypothetical protein ABII89_01000 [Candidatus Omnitrophota bacterium]
MSRPVVETMVEPRAVYVADYPVRPRWRLAFIVQSRSDSDLEVVEYRILHHATPSAPWLLFQRPKAPHPGLIGQYITIGSSRIVPGAFPGIELRDCFPGTLPSAIRIEVDVHDRQSTGLTTVSEVVSLIPKKTYYMTFPL